MNEELAKRVQTADMVLSGTKRVFGCRCLFGAFQPPFSSSHTNLTTSTFFTDLERILMLQVHEFIAKQAQLCSTLLQHDAELLKAVRDADTLNDMLAQQLGSSQMMSRNLLQRITVIIETPTNVNAATPMKPSTAP